MKLKRNCVFFNAKTNEVGGTPDWEQTLGQGSPLYLLKESGCSEIINGMAYNIADKKLFSYGKGGNNYITEIVAIFTNVSLKIYDSETKQINYHKLEKSLIVILVKQETGTHAGRRFLKFSKDFSYESINNDDFYKEINAIIPNPWFGYELNYDNEKTGELLLTVMKAPISTPIPNQLDISYETKDLRKDIWNRIADEYSELFEQKGDDLLPSKKYSSTHTSLAENRIFFGAPGTGKSHTIKEKLKHTDGEHYKRITFHPDMDYSSFIGGYKPYTDEDDGDKIKYKFVPQVFIDLYVSAWSEPDEDFYLVIEEINRGNCAEIFGDIFQLLDRNPEYNIEPSTELRKYLESIEKDKYVKLLFDGKLQMPERLSILASMNTSDQSLYPMDSAFKRRWDWQYIPIDTNCTHSNFTIEVSDKHKYSWLRFLEKVNEKIYEVTKSEDKQVGNWFINASSTDNIIDKNTFINKVVFYLWNDVFKDEVFHSDNIFVLLDNENKKVKNISFNDFFNLKMQDELLINLIEAVLDVENVFDEKLNDDAIIDTENEG